MMSLARPKIASVVEAALPTYATAAFGTKFQYFPEARVGGILPASRGFVLSSDARAFDRLFVHAGAERINADMNLAIYYPVGPGNQAKLEDVRDSDFSIVARALASCPNWDFPASSIIHLFPDGDELIVTDDIFVTDADDSLIGIWQSMRFTIAHEARL